MRSCTENSEKGFHLRVFCYHGLRYFDFGGLGGGEGKLICVLAFSQSPQTLVITVSFQVITKWSVGAEKKHLEPQKFEIYLSSSFQVFPSRCLTLHAKARCFQKQKNSTSHNFSYTFLYISHLFQRTQLEDMFLMKEGLYFILQSGMSRRPHFSDIKLFILKVSFCVIFEK